VMPHLHQRMTDLVPYRYAGDDLSAALANQQQMMIQLLQGSAAIQAQLKYRLDQHEDRLIQMRSDTAELAARTRRLETASGLITVAMLDVMLTANWSDAEMNKVGVQLARFSRAHHVTPMKIPHPTLKGGVNGYLPGIVKAWVEEETDYELPMDLRYVD